MGQSWLSRSSQALSDDFRYLDRREKRRAAQVASCSTWLPGFANLSSSWLSQGIATAYLSEQLRTKNLLFLPPSGFWADDDWYDLQMARRLPLCQDCLRYLAWSRPSIGSSLEAERASKASSCMPCRRSLESLSWTWVLEPGGPPQR